MNAILLRYNKWISRSLCNIPENWRINPNYISLSRILLVYIALFLFPSANPWVMLFLAAAVFTLTDSLDGACARAWERATIGGKLLDPICDKVSLFGFLLFLYKEAMIPQILFSLVLFSESLIIVITLYWVYECWQTVLQAKRFGDQDLQLFLVLLDKKIPIQPAGKIKIVMFCVSFILTSLAGIIGNGNLTIVGIFFSILGVIFTAISIPKYLNPPT